MSTTTPLQQFVADHRFVLDQVARAAGFADPVAVDLDQFSAPLLKRARRGPVLPLDGVLVRDWDPNNRKIASGLQLGLRLYEIEGIRFVRVCFVHDSDKNGWGTYFTAVERADYRRFYRVAVRCREDGEPPAAAPVLPPEQLDVLWKNTIGYLDRANLRRIK